MFRDSPAKPDPGETSAGGEGRVRRLHWFTAGFVVLLSLAAALTWDRWTSLREQALAHPWVLRFDWLAVSVVTGVAALLISARLWVWLFHRAGGDAPVAEAAAAWLASNLGRYIPGKVWQLTWIAAYMRARESSGAASLAASLALQAVAVATAGGVAASLLGRAAFAGPGAWTLGIAALILVLALHPGVIRRCIRLGARLLREPDPERSVGARDLGFAGVVMLLVWGIHGVGLWALARGLLSPSPVALDVATGAFAGGYLVGFLVLIAPGGLLVREGAIAAVLHTVSGLALGVAGAFSVVARIWTTVAEVIAFVCAGLFALRALARRR